MHAILIFRILSYFFVAKTLIVFWGDRFVFIFKVKILVSVMKVACMYNDYVTKNENAGALHELCVLKIVLPVTQLSILRS